MHNRMSLACSFFQKYCDEGAGSSVPDPLVHTYRGRGHSYCTHYIRHHVLITCYTHILPFELLKRCKLSINDSKINLST